MGLAREKFKTLKKVFDLFTENTLFKLMSKGVFEGMESPIAVGKETNIFTATTKDNQRVVLKIYRLSTADFNKMYTYIRTDPRFAGLQRSRRKVIFAWARREFKNLQKAREAGIRVPAPIECLNNVLVLEYIGNEQPAPRLKDSPPANANAFFEEVVESIRKLYKAGLVHGDLSAFNILNWNEKPVFIDMSQATTTQDPNALEYLARDIKNICAFFKKLGIKTDEQQILNKIKK